MKKFILSIPFIAFAIVATAQQQITYLDINWKPISDKNKAAYYREGKIYGVDKNGKEILDGWCTWYYINGRKHSKSYFNRGSLDSAAYSWNEDGKISMVQHYQNNVLHGDWTSYNPDGTVKYLAVYKKGEVRHLTFYDKDNIKAINSHLIYDDEWDYDSFIFKDDFTDNHNNWPLGKNARYSIEILPQKLAMKSESDTSVGAYIYYPLPNNYDFFLGANLSFEKGSNSTGHGIIWGFQDWNNYDYFLISAKGYFKTGSVIKGKDFVSNNWTYNTGILKGKSVNHLKVVKEQDIYVFIANDKKLGTSNFIKMAGDSIGFWGQGKKEISYSSMWVKTHFGVSSLNPSERRDSISSSQESQRRD